MRFIFNFRDNVDETCVLYHPWYFSFQSRTKTVAFLNKFRHNNYETVVVTEYNMFRSDFYESGKNAVSISFGWRTKTCDYFLIFVTMSTKLVYFTTRDTFRCNHERKVLHFIMSFVRIITKLWLLLSTMFFVLISTKVTRMLSPYRSDCERKVAIIF